MKKDNVILIGMPGCGKSTLGVLVAKIGGMKFLDTDIGLQTLTGMTLNEMIRRDGVAKFKKAEELYLLTLSEQNTVIATGGSAVYSDAAMKKLAYDGRIVYLRVPYEQIERRVGDLKKRGVVMENGQTLRDLYDERTPLYEKYADVTVDVKPDYVSNAAIELARVLGLTEN